MSEQTVLDILNELDNIAMVSIDENNIGHAYFGEEDIKNIEPDILEKSVLSFFVVKRSDGYEVYIEV